MYVTKSHQDKGIAKVSRWCDKAGKTGITFDEFGSENKDIYRFKTTIGIYWKLKTDRKENLRQSVMFLKQSLESGDILVYSWIQVEEIVADVMTKQESRREALQDIIRENNSGMHKQEIIGCILRMVSLRSRIRWQKSRDRKCRKS